jgi:hypothetical protein
MGKKEEREREDLVEAMGAAHRAHEDAIASGDGKAIEAARRAACDAVRAYHEAKLRGREAAALAATVGG